MKIAKMNSWNFWMYNILKSCILLFPILISTGLIQSVRHKSFLPPIPSPCNIIFLSFPSASRPQFQPGAQSLITGFLHVGYPSPTSAG